MPITDSPVGTEHSPFLKNSSFEGVELYASHKRTMVVECGNQSYMEESGEDFEGEEGPALKSSSKREMIGSVDAPHCPRNRLTVVSTVPSVAGSSVSVPPSKNVKYAWKQHPPRKHKRSLSDNRQWWKDSLDSTKYN